MADLNQSFGMAWSQCPQQQKAPSQSAVEAMQGNLHRCRKASLAGSFLFPVSPKGRADKLKNETMENTQILGQFKFVYFGKLMIYPDRVEVKSLVKHEVIPASKIANVSYNKLTGQLIIETTGGGKTHMGFWGGVKVGTEALRLISSLR